MTMSEAMSETMSELYRGAWVVAYREVLSFVRDRTRVLASLTFPLLFLAIFGAGFSDIVGVMAGGVNLVTFMYPGIIAMAVLTSALSAGMSVVSDREAGFLREILVAPVSRAGVVLGKATGTAGVALLQALLLLAIAPFVGVRLDSGVVLKLLPIVTILALGLSCLGILIGSFVTSQQGYQTLLQLLVFPMVFLAGVFFPVDRVPLWMAILSKANPVTYGVDAIRQIFLGSGPTGAGLGVTVLGHTMTIAEEVVVIGALGIILLTGAIWAFSRQE
jgi:ABC-2 type transport system permease protein